MYYSISIEKIKPHRSISEARGLFRIVFDAEALCEEVSGRRRYFFQNRRNFSKVRFQYLTKTILVECRRRMIDRQIHLAVPTEGLAVYFGDLKILRQKSPHRMSAKRHDKFRLDKSDLFEKIQ